MMILISQAISATYFQTPIFQLILVLVGKILPFRMIHNSFSLLIITHRYSECTSYMSHNEGITWSDMSINMGHSNNIIVHAVPHLVSNDTSFNTYEEILDSVKHC